MIILDSICKNKIVPDVGGWPGGHNPYPVKDNGRCYGKCNYEKVIPTRLVDKLGIENDNALEISKEVQNVNAIKIQRWI